MWSVYVELESLTFWHKTFREQYEAEACRDYWLKKPEAICVELEYKEY